LFRKNLASFFRLGKQNLKLVEHVAPDIFLEHWFQNCGGRRPLGRRDTMRKNINFNVEFSKSTRFSSDLIISSVSTYENY
jgi:hypothetical protein